MKGFTLIELLVVVLIIGILFSVALPQYRKAVLKARAAEGVALLYSIAKAEDIYFMANGQYTADFETLDLELPKFRGKQSLGQFYSPGQDFLWEITFSGDKSSYTLYCAALPANPAAEQTCASLGLYSHFNAGRNYYALSRKPGKK